MKIFNSVKQYVVLNEQNEECSRFYGPLYIIERIHM